jgi:1-acyl-sn-glycerol-3-phosphate acyltransferase
MLMDTIQTPSRSLVFIRSSIYWLVLCLSTVLYSSLLLLSFALPFRTRYVYAKAWGVTNLLALRYICKLDYRLDGVENVPSEPVIVFAKHQSAYEIIVILSLFRPLAWVAKRELLLLPFFGWAFMLTRPIVINRKAGTRAVDQLVRQGSRSLAEGRSVMIFPEGTRTEAGAKTHYRIGGAILAEKSGYPVLPIAHNAGEYWPRNSFIKWPGTVTLSIGPPIRARDKKAEQILAEARAWIEAEMTRIGDPRRWRL